MDSPADGEERVKLITNSIGEIYLLDGWEYSNGGAMECSRGLMIRYRFIEERESRMQIYNHNRQPMDIEEISRRLSEAIKNLSKRGYPTNILKKELGRIAGIAAYCYDYMTSKKEWVYHTNGLGMDWFKIIKDAESVGSQIELAWD